MQCIYIYKYSQVNKSKQINRYLNKPKEKNNNGRTFSEKKSHRLCIPIQLILKFNWTEISLSLIYL